MQRSMADNQKYFFIYFKFIYSRTKATFKPERSSSKTIYLFLAFLLCRYVGSYDSGWVGSPHRNHMTDNIEQTATALQHKTTSTIYHRKRMLDKHRQLL